MHRFEPLRSVVVGLVGGIAAGKTTIAKLFAEAGFEHVDADAVARVVIDEPTVRSALAARFGPGLVPAVGAVDRAGLAALVFADPNARADLEAITHPPIRARIRTQLDAARLRHQSVLLDAPLLLEGPLHADCDVIVYVDAPDALRAERARARGWSEADWRQREKNQLPLDLKRARASAIIRVDGDLEATRRQVERLLLTWSHL